MTVDGTVELDPAQRLAGGELVAVRPAARRPAPPPTPGFALVHEDPHLVVIEKPAGVSSVPFERKEGGTALDLVREAWRAQGRRATVTPLYTVHRIDKETSGLLCFAKTRAGERGLHRIFQQHLAERSYLAVAHGQVDAGRIESQLVRDRGDGLRGSAGGRGRAGGGRGREPGQRAVTHVEVLERLPRATLCRVRLETGRTHQIRIHLAERGHPLVGETVYIRDFHAAGADPLPAERLMLHAHTLGFDHPVTGEPLSWQADPPEDFRVVLGRLRGR